jgi:hypothetical protein
MRRLRVGLDQHLDPKLFARQYDRFLTTSTKAIREGGVIPVRIFWNANSTFEASNADVSINDNPFSADGL